MNGTLVIKTEKHEQMINLRNVKNITRTTERGGVELCIGFMDNCSVFYLGVEAERIWEVVEREVPYGLVVEVNLCGSDGPAAGQVVGGAGGLAGESGDVRCLCGHFLCDHVGGMDCSLCSCELFEEEEEGGVR